MSNQTYNFGPQNEEEEEIFAVEELILSTQLLIQRSMREVKTNQSQLAKALKLSDARISQLLNDEGANMTLATVAKIANAMNVKFALVKETKTEETKGENIPHHLKIFNRPARVWSDDSANKNDLPLDLVA
ncbi:helix-turn-helix transcriptional regulator [Roseobacter sp. N2S]|uniref:helix-turn-helix domain-containing protein n=1 Tax=Roseobacter sp. N2S TaxID=2663844 RepID=UPI002862E4EF|nr:helix-turn-helix transcriptional regulator [Roseobacter sp. N2S]MDR6263992.1 transcriptional regulator with XRE-family HTH domain [Roseobacter sp. N2S]